MDSDVSTTQRWCRQIPFKVDIAGIIEIMGSSLYSRATTPIRELIQNAHDAVMRRRQQDLSYKGRIDLVQDAEALTLQVLDDGIGLTAEEAERYLGTLGIGITGLIKKGAAPDASASGDAGALIGQFGIGLFSAFMLAGRIVVETRRVGDHQAVRWEAGPGTDITLSSCERQEPGTTVTLFLSADGQRFARDARLVEESIKEYADFLPIPIFLNHGTTRVNLINATWFDPTPDPGAIELEMESYFQETPLEIIPMRMEQPNPIAGALYITPQRTPGFSGQALLTVTIRRMVISRRIEGLLPEWASFVRGVLELGGCAPTASREDLVRDAAFEAVRACIDNTLHNHLEGLAQRDPQRLATLIAWHRYTLAGSALQFPRLRQLLRRAYIFTTSQGPLNFAEILERSDADPLFESEADKVIWYNGARQQENWANTLFASQPAPCVHALRSFEESLLAAMCGDSGESALRADLRPIGPSAPGFAQSILGVHDLEEAPATWQEFLACSNARVFCASFGEKLPVLAFMNEQRDLLQVFEELKKRDVIPAGFQRLVDRHFDANRPGHNELLLNRKHPVVAQALAQSIHHPLASIVRLLAFSALTAAGAATSAAAQRMQAGDLDWIAQALSRKIS